MSSSVVTVPTTVTVHLKHFHTETTKCWIKVFGSEFFAPGYEEGCTFAVPKLEAPLTIALPFREAYPSKHAYFFVWVFAQQHHDGSSGELKLEPKEKRTTPVHDWTGTATVSIGNRVDREQCPVQDINGGCIGHVVFSPPEDPGLLTMYADKVRLPPQHKQFKRLCVTGNDTIKALGDWTKDGLEALHKQHFPNGSNITQHLPRYIYRTVNQHCGNLPMWVWPVVRIRSLPSSSFGTGVATYFKNAERNARFLLNLPSQHYSSTTEICEVIGEVLTLPTRAMQYVLDQSRIGPQKTQAVDHWAHPHDQPVGDLMSGDCEDFALLMLQESVYLRTCPGLQSMQISQTEQRYITFMCAMTLRLHGGRAKWTYHMAVLKLDRMWVTAKLGLSKNKQLPKEDDRLPAMLLEGTAYTTSCWEYDVDDKKSESYKCSKVNLPDCETAAKTPPVNIRTNGLYGHIISLFSPELWQAHGIAQIELGQNQKAGADVTAVMNYDAEEDKVQWACLQMDEKQRHASKANKKLARLAASFPRPPLPTLSKVRDLPPSGSISRKRVSCCIRKIDWKRREPDIRKELFKKAQLSSPSDVGALSLRINSRQKIVYLYA